MKKTMTKTMAMVLATVTVSTTALLPSVTSFANQKTSQTGTTLNQLIKLDEAKTIALKEAKSGEVIGVSFDDGRKPNYDVTILDGTVKKEIELDAFTGKVIEVNVKDISKSKKYALLNTKRKVTFEDAEKLVAQKYPKADLQELHLDVEKGNLVYEVTVQEGFYEISVDIDANTGAFGFEETDFEEAD